MLRLSLISALFALAAWPSLALAGFKDKTPVDLGQPAPKDGAADPSAAPVADPSSVGSMALRTIIGLAVVIGVVLLVARLLRALKERQGGAGSNPAVEVLSRTNIEKDMGVYTIRVGEEVVVVSVAAGRTTLLRTLSWRQALEEGLDAEVSAAVPASLRQASSDLGSWVRDLRSGQRNQPMTASLSDLRSQPLRSHRGGTR